MVKWPCFKRFLRVLAAVWKAQGLDLKCAYVRPDSNIVRVWARSLSWQWALAQLAKMKVCVVVLGVPSSGCTVSLVRDRQGVTDRFRQGRACATYRKESKRVLFTALKWSNPQSDESSGTRGVSMGSGTEKPCGHAQMIRREKQLSRICSLQQLHFYN